MNGSNTKARQRALHISTARDTACGAELAAPETCAWVNLGGLYLDRGLVEASRSATENALSRARKHLDGGMEALALSNLGALEQLCGELPRAQKLFQRAHTVLRRVGDTHGSARVLLNQGTNHEASGRISEARRTYAASFEAFKAVGDQRGLAATLLSWARLDAKTGRIGPAVKAFELAVSISQRYGDAASEGLALGNLGHLKVTQGEIREGESLLRTAMEICRAAQPVAGAVFQGVLAVSLAGRGAMESALAFIDEAAQVLAPRAPREYGLLLVRKATIHRYAGAGSAAEEALDAAAEVASSLPATTRADVTRAIIGHRRDFT